MALDGFVAQSLNEAYRRISEVFEPKRRRARGNVFRSRYYLHRERERWRPIGELRGDIIFVPHHAAAFQKEFRLKFVENEKGDPKAIRQLATSSAAAMDGSLPLTIVPKRIFPVLVGYETCLDAFWVNRYANDLFRPYLHRDLAPVVRPLTTMSVEAFEQAIAYTSAGDISWPELLDRRFFGDNQVADYSVAQAIFDWRAEKGRDVRRNELILSEFARIFDRVLAKYRESPGEQATPKT